MHLFLVDPIVLGRLPLENITLLEPKSNFLLGVLDTVGTVADVASDIDGIVTTDGTWEGVLWVGGTKDGTTSLDGITTFPDHGANGTAQHVVDESWEEWLGGEVGIVLLEVLLARADKLDGSELESARLETRDDGADESTLNSVRLDSNEGLLVRHLDVVSFGEIFLCW